MNLKDLQTFARSMLENNRAEFDFVGYKKSYQQEDKTSGIKAILVRPIIGLLEGQLEVAENHIKVLFKYIQPTPICYFSFDQIDDKWYLVVVVEPSNRLTEVTDKGAHKTKLPKGGRYIRVNRDIILPNTKQKYVD